MLDLLNGLGAFLMMFRSSVAVSGGFGYRPHKAMAPHAMFSFMLTVVDDQCAVVLWTPYGCQTLYIVSQVVVGCNAERRRKLSDARRVSFNFRGCLVRDWPQCLKAGPSQAFCG